MSTGKHFFPWELLSLTPLIPETNPLSQATSCLFCKFLSDCWSSVYQVKKKCMCDLLHPLLPSIHITGKIFEAIKEKGYDILIWIEELIDLNTDYRLLIVFTVFLQIMWQHTYLHSTWNTQLTWSCWELFISWVLELTLKDWDFPIPITRIHSCIRVQPSSNIKGNKLQFSAVVCFIQLRKIENVIVFLSNGWFSLQTSLLACRRFSFSLNTPEENWSVNNSADSKLKKKGKFIIKT